MTFISVLNVCNSIAQAQTGSAICLFYALCGGNWFSCNHPKALLWWCVGLPSVLCS